MMDTTIKIIKQGLDFGSFEHRKSPVSFFIKMFIFLCVGVISGYFLDTTINKYYKKEYNTEFVILQTLLIFTILYLFVVFMGKFASEFQSTMAGGLFIAIFYGFQQNYITHLKEFLQTYIE